MSSRDPVAEILARAERPVEPSSEFAAELLERLLVELGAEAPAPARRRLPRLLPGAPRGLRLALGVLIVLLLLAAVATATYFGVRSWVSSGPRGVQFTSDFELAEIFRDAPGRSRLWPAFVLASDGSAIYALRQSPSHPQRRTDLVRIAPLRDGRARAELLLSYDDLADPALWDPGVDLSGSVMGEDGGYLPVFYPAPELSVAPNGDVFLVAACGERTTRSTARSCRGASR